MGATMAGLSPRVRGNRVSAPSGPSSLGSIPACAGEPLRLSLDWSALSVYPRVCGGTAHRTSAHGNAHGLSPRVRGNRSPNHWSFCWFGSIPACAGEPYADDGLLLPGRVYPRVCGGTSGRGCVRPERSGLSPRVRGNLGREHPVRLRERSIPACAGEPAGLVWPGRAGEVYPRVCGGTTLEWLGPHVAWGLSPRVRGNQVGSSSRRMFFGSIPACAGEPVAAGAVRRLEGVYPRVCGGTAWTFAMSAWLIGLSPRVRGNLLLYP